MPFFKNHSALVTKTLLLCLSCLVLHRLAIAAPRLPHVFSSHMVLQRNAPINIWGWAKPGEKLTIRFHEQEKLATADRLGMWKIQLSPESAGGPFTMTITGEKTIHLDDILVGEVWICSGQSNMEWSLKNASNGAEEIKHANYPQIRHLTVPRNTSFAPLQDILNSAWEVCSPQTAGKFTAVGYFFARKLHQELNIPIGLIHSSWGGSNIETWISSTTLAREKDFAEIVSILPSSIEGINSAIKTKTLSVINNFQHNDLNTRDIETWKASDYNDNNWSKIKAPGFWEGQGLPGVDGVVWYRKEITLTAEQANAPATIRLSTIDDDDDTYVNGTWIGGIADYRILREYPIPKGLLKPGKNIIAVRVKDTGYGGGIYGDSAAMQLLLPPLSALSLAGEWKVKVDTSSITQPPQPNSFPSLLFNGMIDPIIPYTMKGIIWYQGESNASRAFQYKKTFPLMISDWRKHWNQGNFPFYFVQLASFNANNENGLTGSKWAELREAQSMALTLANTGMAVTTDIGTTDDIHPRNKKDVGERLALNALHGSYGKQIVYSGPKFQSLETKGNEAILRFTETGSGLMAKDKYGYLKGFQVAGPDQQFRWARAFIRGNTVVVINEDVQKPVAVRYAWTDDTSEANLFNKEGLPASPFRTDLWQGLTVNEKYTIQKY